MPYLTYKTYKMLFIYAFVTTHFEMGVRSDKKAVLTNCENFWLLSPCAIMFRVAHFGTTLFHILLALCFAFFRWIIQRAFFYPKTLGVCGCAGITWRSLCLHCPDCCEPTITGIRYSQALTLDDLDDLTPIYIGCITSNQWRRTPSPREDHYEVLTMSPQDITRLDRSQDEQELRGKLMPMDLK